MKRVCAVTDIFTISHILNNNDAIIVCPDFHVDCQCNCETVLSMYLSSRCHVKVEHKLASKYRMENHISDHPSPVLQNPLLTPYEKQPVKGVFWVRHL